MDFDKGILDEFITEASEHLASVEDALLGLEKAVGGPSYADIVNKVFRAVHTVKGTSGFMGLKNLADVAHLAETILSLMRSGEMLPNPANIDALLGAVDAIREMLANVETSNEYDISEVLERLKSVLEGGKPPEAIPEGLFDGGNTPVPDEPKIIEAVEPTSAVAFDMPKAEPGASSSPSSEANLELLLATNSDDEPTAPKAVAPPPQVAAATPQAPHSPSSTSPPSPPPTVPKQAAAPVSGEQPEKAVERRKDDRGADTVRVKLPTLNKLMQLAGELVLVRNQQLLSKDKSDPLLKAHIQRLNIVTSELQETIMATRMQPIGNILGKFPRVVRDLGKKLGKQVELEISGNEVELDNTILEALSDPLTHLIRNSCDHGVEMPEQRLAAGKPEMGRIAIRAFHGNGQVNMEIADDGKGIDPKFIAKKCIEKGLKTEEELSAMIESEIVSLILLPGFSTAEKLSDVSGRGVGMDVVKASIEKMGGSLDIESQVGKGTVMRMRLPLTMAILQCLVVEVGNIRFAIPQANIEELACLYDEEVKNRIESAGSREVFRLRNRLLPMIRLEELLKRKEKFTDRVNAEIMNRYRQEQERKFADAINKKTDEGEDDFKVTQSLNFVVLKVNMATFGLIVDRVVGTEEIVVKPMHPALKSLYCYTGVTVMGDGKVALILDVQGVARHAGISTEESTEANESEDRAIVDMQNVLLFKNGANEQFAVGLPAIKRIETISRSRIEFVGGKEYITVEGISTMVVRLDKYLNVSPCDEKEVMYLLMPKHFKHHFGVLASSLLDTIETSSELNTESYLDDGVLGTSIIKDRMTLFPDINAIIEKAEPGWFQERVTRFAGSAKKNILLVDDSQFFRQLVRKHLESFGYMVVLAEHGQDAIRKLKEADFDLIISDIQMPVMDGIHLIKALRGNANWRSKPAIALSGLNSEASIRKATEAGFDRYALKSDKETLLSLVADLLNPASDPIPPHAENANRIHGNDVTVRR
jgi:two-component system chemotaxis sensor kinase CheA